MNNYKIEENSTPNHSQNFKQDQEGQNILIRSCLFKDPSKVLSPLIFTKSIKLEKTSYRVTRRLAILEQLLGLTVLTYYKSSYDIENTILEIRKNLESNKQFEKEIYKNSKKQRKRGDQDSNGSKKEMERQKKNKKGKKNQKNKLVESINMLDYLVSPLKEDFEFGKFIRNMGFEIDCNIRNLFVRIWKTV